MSERSVQGRERTRKSVRDGTPGAGGSAIDEAGEALIAMLNEAATLSNESRDRATGMVDELSGRLEAARDRLDQLQTEVERMRGRALGAEKWLALIQKEIEQTLIGSMTESGCEQPPLH
jgi:hypothetical protein